MVLIHFFFNLLQDSDERKTTLISSGEVKERACDSLIMCIVTTLNQGLRNGGGIGDILRAPSSTVSKAFINNNSNSNIKT